MAGGSGPGQKPCLVVRTPSWPMALVGPTHPTPFRGYKHDGYEGGISTPFIVHWPVGIPSDQRGGVVHEPASDRCDAHFVQAGKAEYPAEFAGRKIQPMEGVV